MVELFQYFTKLVEEKKKNPADDLVTVFANAEVNGEKLPPMDVLTYCLIIVIAGNETTRNATSGGMLALAQNPGELARIQKDLSLLPSAVEEIVRWTSPIIHFARTTTQDVPRQEDQEGPAPGAVLPVGEPRRGDLRRSLHLPGRPASEPTPGLRYRRALLRRRPRGAPRAGERIPVSDPAPRRGRGDRRTEAASLPSGGRHQAPADPVPPEAGLSARDPWIGR
jgi:hypothetical protein